jgi:hypothetical protein
MNFDPDPEGKIKVDPSDQTMQINIKLIFKYVIGALGRGFQPGVRGHDVLPEI